VLAGCSAAALVGPYDGSASQTEVIYVISGGWHTQLGLPVGAINGPLAAMRRNFRAQATLSSAEERAITTWLEIPGIGDILRAVASGPAVMLVFHSKSPLKRFSGFRTLLLSMCRRVVSNVSRSCCGTIWLQTRKELPAALVPVSIPKASSMPPLERAVFGGISIVHKATAIGASAAYPSPAPTAAAITARAATAAARAITDRLRRAYSARSDAARPLRSAA
jgi:hypothetical protein